MRLPILGLVAATAVLTGCDRNDDASGDDEISFEKLAAMGLDWGTGGDDGDDTTTPTVEATHLVAVSNDAMKGPLRMATASDGSVWVTDPKAGAIHKISRTGEYSRSITTISRPLGIAIDAAGQLIVGDGNEGRVVYLNSEGEITGTVGAGATEFSAPQDIAVDSSGYIWILDSINDTLVKSTDAGIVVLSFGTRGTAEGEFHFPASIALDEAAGEVYISDSNNGRVQVFDMDGVFQRAIGTVGAGDGELLRTQGVALSGSERVFVAEVFQGRVGTFTATDGSFEGWVAGYGGDEGQLKLPSDLLFDDYGRLWIASYGTSRVEIYGIDSYTEPPGATPANAAVSPSTFDITGHGTIMTLYVDVPAYDTAIDGDSVRIDGDIPLDPTTAIDTDVVYDGATYEAQYHFDRPSLQERYGEGTHTVTVEGSLTDGNEFEGSFEFTLTNPIGDTGE